jgi:chromosomal replication initiator protein
MPLPTISEIQLAVAKSSRVRVDSIRAPFGARRNPRRIAWARQLAICLADRLTEHSRSRIGHFFGGRDHSTVWHACQAVEKRRRRDRRLHNRMRRITLELVRHG